MRNGLLSVVLIAAVAAGLPGCGDEAETELTLLCATGIRPATEALIAAFEAANPDVKIATTYAGSGRLLGQITASKTGDLFMPGAEPYVDKAIEQGLADGATKRHVACFVPVLFVAKDNTTVHGLKDLATPGLRVGFGDERAAAIGKTTLKLLARNGIDPKSINVVTKTGTVNELPLAVKMGSVDAVICWDANARHFADDGRIVAIPIEQNVISTIPAVVLTSTRHREASLRFIDFITSDSGRRILTDHGYTVEIPQTQSASPNGKGSR